MHYQLIFLSILSSICDYTFGSQAWDYGKHGPDVWKDLDIGSQCAGKRQSPINIQTACTDHKNFEPFNLTSVHNEPLNFTLKNNGHTIKASTNNIKLFLTGANLSGTFSFDSFHLHWGPNYNTGSEHQVNGDKFAGESHFIYKHDELDQYVVLSFLMESRNVTQYRTSFMHPLRDVIIENQWEKYFDEAQNLIHENDSKTINLTLSSLMGSNLNDFWRYNGSLSTPPCSENVIWTVFKEPIFILNYEFEAFRDDLFFESYRGPQPLYQRSVLRSFTENISSSIPEQNCCLKNKGSKIEIFLIITNNGFLRIFCFTFFYSFINYYIRFH